VFTIALGSPKEPLNGRDLNRALMIPPPDYKTLRGIAKRTGAEYFKAPNEAGLHKIYGRLAAQLGFVKRRREVTFAFAAAGLLLAGAGALLSALWGARLP
jgi:Ca-activated chloride channel family protein